MRKLFLLLIAASICELGVAGEPKKKTRASSPAYTDFSTCDKPAWPANALRDEREGTTTLRFLVGPDGKIENAKIGVSSGSNDLDKAALEALGKCQFIPEIANGRPTKAWLDVQYVWTLKSEDEFSGQSSTAAATGSK